MEYLQRLLGPPFIYKFDSLVQLLPLVLEGELPVDDDVDLPGAGLHGHLDLLQPGVQAVLATGEPRGHRSHWHILRLVPGEVVIFKAPTV